MNIVVERLIAYLVAHPELLDKLFEALFTEFVKAIEKGKLNAIAKG